MESLGILFVVMYHLATYDYGWNEDAQGLFFLRYYLRTFLSTCVPIFFFANGYLLLNRSFDLKKHIRKSIALVIMTVIWGAIGLLSMEMLDGVFLSTKEFLTDIIQWKPLGWINHLWYMGALVCIYVFFPLIKTAYDNQRSHYIFFLIMAAIFSFGNTSINHILSITASLLLGKNNLIDMNVFNMFSPFSGMCGYGFVYFAVGGLIKNCEDRIRRSNGVTWLALGALVVSSILLFVEGIILTGVQGYIWDVVWYGYDSVFTFINVLAIYIICLKYSGRIKLIEKVSRNTLGIFFMHNIVIHIIWKIMPAVGIMNTFVGSMLLALVVIAVCILIAELIKKIPVFKRLLLG